MNHDAGTLKRMYLSSFETTHSIPYLTRSHSNHPVLIEGLHWYGNRIIANCYPNHGGVWVSNEDGSKTWADSLTLEQCKTTCQRTTGCMAITTKNSCSTGECSCWLFTDLKRCYSRSWKVYFDHVKHAAAPLCECVQVASQFWREPFQDERC